MRLIRAGTAAVEVETIGTGRDLVLLHSLLADRSAFERAAPLLARTRRVWLVNLPGYGASSAIAADSIEHYADHIVALLDSLQLSRDTDVLGNGFGGFIAVALAARHGGRIARLIAAPALSAFPEPAKQPFYRMAELAANEGMRAVLDAAIRRMFPEAFAAAHPEIVAERKAALENADPTCFRTACLALAKLDLSGAAPAIRNPTLVLVGSEDATTPPALAGQLALSISGAQFKQLPGCGHCPQLEDPTRFAAAIDEFLDGPIF
jgi:3-oxoadipate enol-lactonase